MTIFFGKYSGKEIQSIDTSYLVWLIESCDKTDYSLREACKSELSHRLSLDFDEPKTRDRELIEFQKTIHRLEKRCSHLLDLLGISVICKGNISVLNGYDMSPPLLAADLLLIKEINNNH